MDELLKKRDPVEHEDFYELLGCDETSTAEQISTEFKLLARKHHPDKVGSTEEKVSAEQFFMKLERAKRVLLDEDTRSKYNQWRGGGFKDFLSFDDWLAIQSRVHSSIHWATLQHKRPSLPAAETATPAGEETKRLKTDPSSSESGSNTSQSTAPNQSPLEEFRRGSEGTSLLSQFRDYRL